MTVKDDPPIVHAELAPDEPEIDLTQSSAPAPAPFSQALDNPPPSTVPHAYAASAPVGGTTSTTTTYTIPPPQQQQQQQHGQSAPASIPQYDNFGRFPAGTQCRYCQAQMVTRTRDRIDAVTIIAMILILLIFWPLFWLPLCIPACKTTDHYCSSCNRKIGRAEPCS